MSEEKKKKDIELRSEKVRNIVGKVPPRLLRIGISVISLIIVSVLALAYFIPYPQYKTIIIHLYSNPLIRTVKAPDSGIFYLDSNSQFVDRNQQIGWIINQNDSITNLYSDISGKIILNLENEDYVQKNSILFSITPDSIQFIYAIGYVLPEEIDQIKKGQSVFISSRQESLIGEITYIYPFPETDPYMGKKMFKLKIHFPEDITLKNTDPLLPITTHTGKILISTEPILKQILKRP